MGRELEERKSNFTGIMEKQMKEENLSKTVVEIIKKDW